MGKVHPTDETPRRYDRAFLLSAEKRYQVMEMWEVQRFGYDVHRLHLRQPAGDMSLRH